MCCSESKLFTSFHLAIDGQTLRLEAAFEALSAGGFSNWPAAIQPMRSNLFNWEHDS